MLRREADPDGASVLMLRPAESRPPGFGLSRLRHEFSLAADLGSDWSLRPLGLEPEGRGGLALEDPGGDLLEQRLAGPMPAEIFFPLAIEIVAAIGKVHAAGLAHKDLRPANLLIEAEGRVRVTGFGAASRPGRQAGPGDETLDSGLAYMAPEQTGRVNRTVDARSDLYALGVIFYRMLAGGPPFSAHDRREWVHCHVARQPAPLSLRSAAPPVVQAVVMKLLAKSPEDRYQTAAGLEADLRRCLAEWERSGTIEPFELGRRDVPDRLALPDRLYGREPQLQALREAFNRTRDGGTLGLALISGPSGVGKTALAHAIRPEVITSGGLFAEGKFDAQQREAPYATLVQAFQGLVRQLLAGSESELHLWRDRLIAALGQNIALISGLIPEMAVIIGPAPAIAYPPPLETPNRFRQTFARFIQAFADADHPLVLFLDDLQWADQASLDLLVSLLSARDTRHLFVVATYRDNEAGPGHPLMQALDRLVDAGAAVDRIALAPLGQRQVAAMLADGLSQPAKTVEPLAQLVHQKTAGNPFFVREFAEALQERGLILFDTKAAAWRWRLTPIRTQAITENVADLLAARLGRLGGATLMTIKVMACLGAAAKAATLAAAAAVSEQTLRKDLLEAEQAGLVLREPNGYAFVHDRVLEAAYALIPEQERAGLHLDIGRRLVASGPPDAAGSTVFERVAQLNKAAHLIDDAREREGLAALNLEAGRQARRSTVYAAALIHLRTAASLLRPERWTDQYELAFPIELHLGECEFLTGDLASADQRLSSLAELAGSLPDRAAVACLRVALYQALDRDDRAIETGLACLSSMGEDWPVSPSDSDMRAEYRRLWSSLGERTPAELADLPVMTDPDRKAALDVMTVLLAPALTRDANLFRLLISRMVTVSLAFGNSDGSSLGYLYLGLLLREQKDDLAQALAFGRLGLALVDRGLDRFKSRVLQGYGTTCSPWTEPLQVGLPFIDQGFAAAQDSGDPTFAAFATWLGLLHRLALGLPLERVEQAADEAIAFAQGMRFGLMATLSQGQARFIAALRGNTPDIAILGEDEADEARFAASLTVSRHFAHGAYWHRIRKLTCLYLAGRHEEAAALSLGVEPPLTACLTVCEAADLHFYGALAHAACCSEGPPASKTDHRDALLAHAKALDRLAVGNPAGFGARARLIAAEIGRLDRRFAEAGRLYEAAVAASRAQDLAHDEAVALEVAGRFYQRQDLSAAARGLFAAARAAYHRWGALAKVRLLDKLHPDLAPTAPPAELPSAPDAERLDLATMIKAAQAISSETDLDRLVETLLRLALESAGAERGALLLNAGGALKLQAVAVTEGDAIRVDTKAGFEAGSDLPQSVLNYVARTRTPLVLDDAGASPLFGQDEQVRAQGLRSILCHPLLKQTQLVGLLYLENRLASHAFGAGSPGLLELVAAQAAISLENVRLYESLQRQEARTRRLVESDLIGIFFWSFGGPINSANDAFLKIVGYTQADLAEGRIDWRSMTPPEQLPRDQEMAAIVRTTGRCPAYEKVFIRKDGVRVPVLIGAVLLQDDGVDGVAFVLDQTERAAAERDRDARRLAEAASQAKSEFLASMSHELRTPLNGILGYAQVLARDQGLDPRQRRGLGVIQHSGQHLLTLIDDILDISRIEAGKLELHSAAIDLMAFLDAIGDMVVVKAHEKGLRLVRRFDRDLPPVVLADEIRLRQVLLNLLGNAIKFTDRGHVRLSVGRGAGGRLRFAVEDSGIGISTDQLETIFQPFDQVGDVHRRQGGSGMGLAISRRIIRLMGGDIRVESRPGRGSEFSFELDLPSAPEVKGKAKMAGEITGYLGPRRTILLVDDVADNRSVLADLLQGLGFAIIEAENGREGLERAEAEPPDLMVTDLAMPEMDGLEATRRLRRSPPLAHVPVLMVSARTAKVERRASAEAGADAFLPKPIDAEQLLEVIGRLMKLEWTRGLSAGAPVPSEGLPAGESTVVPPPETLQTLHELALMGMMGRIVRWADDMADREPTYADFCSRIRTLAENMESRAILALVERQLEFPQEASGGR